MVVTLVVLGTLGLGYRYLAFRWWPEWVVKTTPSIEHLIDCRLQSDGANTDYVEWRLFEKEGFPPSEVFKRLERRITRAANEDELATLAQVISACEGISEEEKVRRWNLLVKVVHDPAMAAESGYISNLLVGLFEEKPGQVDDLFDLWSRRMFARTGMIWRGGTLSENTCFHYLMYAQGVNIIEKICQKWSSWNDIESQSLEVYARTCPAEKVSGYRKAILAAPLPWAQSTLVNFAARVDAEDFSYEVMQLRPELESSFWIGLSRRSDQGIHVFMARERERWLSVLNQGTHDAKAAVLILLGNTEQHQYLPDILPFLHHESSGLQRLAIVSIVQFGDPADLAAFLPLIEDRECDRTVCRAIEALDDGRALGLIQAGMAASANPDAWRMALDVVAFPEAEAVVPIP